MVFLVLAIVVVRGIKKEIEAKEREHAQREIIEKQKKELEIANKKLEAFDVLKSKFLSLASHQLRNPISAIISCTSMFLDGSFGEISEVQKQMLSQMFQGAQDMNEDVEKYLTLAKIDQGGLQYNLKELDMSDLVSAMTERQKLVAKNKGLDLSFETDGNSPYIVNGDKVQLKQVAQNLIDNAMKFTKEGWIKVKLSKDQATKKIRLAISDSGRGIKPEIIPTLFKEFSRGDGAQVDVGGSGIGIYAAKEIVEKGHGGKIWVESGGDGKGSTFTVELPEFLLK
jgi:signal transduction histidine kinase